MPVHEISDIIYKYTDETVKIVNIRIGLQCTVCGNEWGVKVENELDLIRQVQKFVCLPCYQKKIADRNVRSVDYDNKQKFLYKDR